MYFSAGWWRNDDEEGVRPSRFPWLRAGGTGGRSFRALRFSWPVGGRSIIGAAFGVPGSEGSWPHPWGVRIQRVRPLGERGARLTPQVGTPQGETTHYILCVAVLLHPLLSLTHWIFRSLMLPYKSSSHSAKCVRCAPPVGGRLCRRATEKGS